MKKKMVSMLLTVSMAIGLLTGCGSASTNTDDAATMQNEPAETDTTEVGSSEASAEAEGEVVTIDLFVTENWFTNKEWTGAVCDAITEKTGVKFNVTIAADYNQLPVLIASGDAPEMVFSSVDYSLMCNSDVSYDWGSLIEQYCPEWVIPEETKKLYTMSDGNFYTLLNSFSTQAEWEADSIAAPATFAGLAINNQIMEELGNPEIKSLDDLEAVFAEVKEKYPDVVPLVMNSVWMSYYFAEQMGVNREPSFFVNDQGNVQYWFNQPGQLAYYKKINEWYRKGYIMAENYAFNNEDEPLQYAINNKCFAYSHTSRAADRVNAAIKTAGGTNTFSALTEQLTDTPKYDYTWTGWAGTYITKNCKNPEAAIKVMKFLHTEEGMRLASWGIEGEDYTWNEKGFPEFIVDVSDTDAMAKRGLNNWGLMGGSGVIEALGSYQEGSEYAKTLVVQKPYVYYNPYLGMIKPEQGSEEYNIKSKIDEMIKNESPKVFLAESEEACEVAFDTMLRTAQDMGVEQLETYATEIYNNAQ